MYHHFIKEDLIPAGSDIAKELMAYLNPYDPPEPWQAAIYGLLSGFPICCIRFYITEWMPYLQTHGMEAANIRWPQDHEVGRVRCRLCSTWNRP